MDTAPIKLQDFAKQNGVTDRAIQKHLKKHEAELQGHFWRKGPNGTWLDEFAQMYIKNLLREQPIVISETSDQIDALEQENKMLLQALNDAKDKIIDLQEQNSQLAIKSAKVELLEADNQAKEQEKKILEGFIQDAKTEIAHLNDEKDVLSADNALKDKTLEDERKNAQKLSDELTAALAENEAMKNASLWRRLFGWKNKE